MPHRQDALFAITTAAIVLAVHAPVRGQGTGAKDLVVYFDHGRGEAVTVADAVVRKESAAGIEFLAGKDAKTVPSPDILRVEYGGLPGLTVGDVIAIRQLEEADDLAKTQAKYADLLKKAGPASPKTKRYLAFREAITGAKQADQRTKPEEFRADAERSIKQLTEFAQQNDKSWEVWPAYRTAARMQMELGDFVAAADTLGKLAAAPDLGPDLRADVRLDEVVAKLRSGGDVADDLTRIEGTERIPPAGRLRDRLNVLKVAANFPKPSGRTAPAKPVEAVAAMEKAIADAATPAARATGYGLLGDLYSAHGLTRDAMWAYLWVDVVYPQDELGRVVALHRLAAVFETLGDGDRAELFREKLPAAR
jgi:hypothetical protein